VIAFLVSGVAANNISSSTRQGNKALSEFWHETVVNNASTLPYDRLNSLALSSMAPLAGQNLVMPDAANRETLPLDDLGISQSGYDALHFKASSLIARIDSPSAMDELDATRRVTLPKLMIDHGIIYDRRDRLNDYQQIKTLLSSQRDRHRQELEEREALLQRLQGLWSKGFVSTTQMLQEQAVVNSLRNQLLQIDRDGINADFNSKDQRQQADQAKLNSLQLRNQLQAGLVAYMSKVFIITPPDGFHIVATMTRNGMQVKAGDEILTYSTEKPTLPQVIPVFVDSATSQQLSEGMQVLVTPRGISRAQYGGIPGTVVEVRKLPLPQAGMAAHAGGRTLATSIEQSINGAVYLAQVKLEQAEPAYCQQMLSARCYRWSTRRQPPFPVRLGTLADVQINVQYQRPVEFVMPALRKALGMVVENR
jgi:hypothetical protein